MTINQIIERTEQEIAEMQTSLNGRQPVSCPHQLCEVCMKAKIEGDKEAELVFNQLQEKIQLINDLKSAQ